MGQPNQNVMWKDLLEFIGSWLYEGFSHHPREFEISLIMAFSGTVLLWVAGVYFPSLFNRRFHPEWNTHAACGLASAPSLCLLLLLLCSRHAPAALSKEIDYWAAELAR